MFWTKVAQFGPPGTPQKSAFFQESGRKRMKEWNQVTFTKEWINALDDTRILAPTHFQNLVSFPRYGRLKKKCWYKLICNGTYWLLLTGHFGLVFIRPSQWSITAVIDDDAKDDDAIVNQISRSWAAFALFRERQSLSVPCKILAVFRP